LFVAGVMKVDPRRVLAHHPSLGELYEGDFVATQSGFQGRICGVSDLEIHLQRLWSPRELLDRLPAHLVPPGRTLASFASNERVLGVNKSNFHLSEIIEKLTVFDYQQILSSSGDQFFFYRQIVDDLGTEWRLEPVLTPTVVSGQEGILTVENPENVYNYCKCGGDRLLYPAPGDIKRAKIGDVESGYILFECPQCDCRTLLDIATARRDGGNKWKESRDMSEASQLPSDPKREVIVEKLLDGLRVGLVETPDSVLGDEAVLKQFCIDVERVVHDLYGDKPRDYKARVFTLSFNLSDSKNCSLRRRILQGEFSPQELAVATSDELASDLMQEQRQEQREKYFKTEVLQKSTHFPEPPPMAKKPKVEESLAPPSAEEPVVGTVDVELSPGSAELDKNNKAFDDVRDVPTVHASSDSQQIKSVTADASVQELLGYIKSLNEVLDEIESGPLRQHMHLYVDYYLRHVQL
jgi:hypothetical protein